jgi:type I restriction enzyme, S subunit
MKTEQVLTSSDETSEIGELPYDWRIVRIGDFCKVMGGKRLPKGYKYSKTPTNHPYIRVTNFHDMSVKLNELEYIDKNTQKIISSYTISKNDLYISIAGSIGKVGIIPESIDGANFTENAAKIVLPSNIDKKFLCLVLNSKLCQKQIEQLTIATNQPKLALFRIKEIFFPLPPLAEQQSIVTRTEAVLEHVNAARGQLRRMPLIMKRFRKEVLAAACSGRLTEGWRDENPDVESGSQLLERLTENRKKIKKVGTTFENDTFFEKLPELPITWTWSTIQQTAERVTVGHVGPMKNEYRSEGIPFLRCQNVRENYFDSRGLVYISSQFHESLKKSALEPGDLVVVRSGNVGVCCIIPESLSEANCSDLVIVKKPFGFVPKFGAYYVNSLAQKWIDFGTVGIALSHFNTKSVATLPIPIPPLNEQYEIVRRVGMLFERAVAFDNEVAAASRRCERLTQAVLGKAFAGKL